MRKLRKSRDLNALLYDALCESLSIQEKVLSKPYFTAVLQVLRFVFEEGMSVGEACGSAAMLHHDRFTGRHLDAETLLREVEHPMQMVKRIGRGTRPVRGEKMNAQ